MKEENSNNTSTRNIFIAGSTTLEPVIENVSFELSKLKSIFKDLSVNSYLTMKAEQKVYEEHRKNKADIVVFILDGAQDDTIKELKVACQGYRKQKRPYPIFFISKESEEFQKFKDIIIANKLKKRNHLQTYESTVDLKLKAYQQVNSILHENNNDKTEFPHSKSDKIKIFLIALAALFCFLLAALIGKYLFAEKPQTERPRHTLLFTGGGSAANFLKNTYIHKEIEDIDDAYFVRMPSKQAWLLLMEEIISPQQNPKYDMVCLSALPATNDDFKRVNSQRDNKIISIYLGEDDLVVYLNKKSDNYETFRANYSWVDRGFITPKELKKLIIDCKKDTTIEVFCTSPDSGTTSKYQDIINECRDTDTIDLNKLMDSSTLKKYTEITFEANPSNVIIVMGSKNYFSEKAKKEKRFEFIPFDVKKSKNSHSESKSIYLYFVASRVENKTNTWRINKSIADFLKNDLQIKENVHKAWEILINGGTETENGDLYYITSDNQVLLGTNQPE